MAEAQQSDEAVAAVESIETPNPRETEIVIGVSDKEFEDLVLTKNEGNSKEFKEKVASFINSDIINAVARGKKLSEEHEAASERNKGKNHNSTKSREETDSESSDSSDEEEDDSHQYALIVNTKLIHKFGETELDSFSVEVGTGLDSLVTAFKRLHKNSQIRKDWAVFVAQAYMKASTHCFNPVPETSDYSLKVLLKNDTYCGLECKHSAFLAKTTKLRSYRFVTIQFCISADWIISQSSLWRRVCEKVAEQKYYDPQSSYDQGDRSFQCEKLSIAYARSYILDKSKRTAAELNAEESKESRNRQKHEEMVRKNKEDLKKRSRDIPSSHSGGGSTRKDDNKRVSVINYDQDNNLENYNNVKHRTEPYSRDVSQRERSKKSGVSISLVDSNHQTTKTTYGTSQGQNLNNSESVDLTTRKGKDLSKSFPVQFPHINRNPEDLSKVSNQDTKTEEKKMSIHDRNNSRMIPQQGEQMVNPGPSNVPTGVVLPTGIGHPYPIAKGIHPNIPYQPQDLRIPAGVQPQIIHGHNPSGYQTTYAPLHNFYYHPVQHHPPQHQAPQHQPQHHVAPQRLPAEGQAEMTITPYQRYKQLLEEGRARLYQDANLKRLLPGALSVADYVDPQAEVLAHQLKFDFDADCVQIDNSHP